ncbi:MmcQ/YjbR family DNA-binding protein [Gilvimarinus chinensis]|uniref:MmcQ/YjbR family DNA-binding protein n=1 Tax=Gilvimarinus chinensis TaxID=396005 RepID=UPI000373E42F|nr:MmcQ/YjbR family DNA-binding protein [Gilvimarinus chinensis]
MNYDQFNEYCRSLPATTYVVQWGGAHVWKVGGKVFAIGGWAKANNGTGNPAFTFKTSELHYELLKDESGYRPAPYLASRGMKWIQQVSTDKSLDEPLTYYLRESHRLVSLNLTKKLQRELGLNQPACE